MRAATELDRARARRSKDSPVLAEALGPSGPAAPRRGPVAREGVCKRPDRTASAGRVARNRWPGSRVLGRDGAQLHAHFARHSVNFPTARGVLAEIRCSLPKRRLAPTLSGLGPAVGEVPAGPRGLVPAGAAQLGGGRLLALGLPSGPGVPLGREREVPSPASQPLPPEGSSATA